MVHRLHILLSRHAKRATALLTVLVVLAGAIGIPVPRPVSKDASQPFPCMHHACGCASAEACWQGCCCMTREQKLAWAQKHQVRPPEKLVERIRHHEASCCRSEECDRDSVEHPAGGPAVRLVLIEDFRKCQGLASLFVVLSQALPPNDDGSFQTDLTLVAWLAPASTSQTASPAFDPATPPPRTAL